MEQTPIPRRVLVTGASGYLGRRLVSSLLDSSWIVYVLVHQAELPKTFKGRGVEEIHGDLANCENADLPTVDAVCHLAAVIPAREDNSTVARRCFEVNALASLRLAEMTLAWPHCRFIYCSTGNFYSAGDAPATEESAIYPSEYAGSYFTSKLAAELYLCRLQSARGLPLVCLRPTSIYGPDMQPNAVIPRFIEAARRNGELEVWDGGRAIYDWVHVDDVVGVILSALRSENSGVYNVGSGVSHSVLECAALVREIYSQNRATIRVLPVTQGFRGFRPVSIARAAAAFGYQPLSLSAGLMAVCREMESRTDALGGV